MHVFYSIIGSADTMNCVLQSSRVVLQSLCIIFYSHACVLQHHCVLQTPCIVFCSHHVLCYTVTMHCVLQSCLCSTSLCSAGTMHCPATITCCVPQSPCIVSCGLMYYVLQTLWTVFFSHYVLCSAITNCSAVIIICVVQTLWTVFCKTLQSLYQFLILFKLETCRHHSVRDTETQLVSAFVFDTIPGGRHRTRNFHLGGHLVVAEVWSRVRLIGLAAR
jgi:hypothetical protein